MLHSKDELNRLYNSPYVDLVMTNDFDAGKALAAAFKFIFPDVKRIADVGCNNGVHIKSMIDVGFECEGYDISQAAIDKAIVPKELIHLADLREPMTVEKRFDMAYAVECIEHIEEEALMQFSSNMEILAPIFVCTPGNQDGTGHFNMQPSTWWIWKLKQTGWIYDIDKSAELHNYLMQKQWDKSLKTFPFPRKGIMVFRNIVENKQSIMDV